MEDKHSFRLIAITPESGTSLSEIQTICRLLDKDFDYVHVRKPAFTESEMAHYLETIPEKYHSLLKLHSHFSLIRNFNLGGLHLNHRNPTPPNGFRGHLSASCHSAGELQDISAYEYVFLSPIFDSICKIGYTSRFSADDLANLHRSGLINGKVIALGGMTAERIPDICKWGFGGAAFLGYLFGNPAEPDARINSIIKTVQICCNSSHIHPRK